MESNAKLASSSEARMGGSIVRGEGDSSGVSWGAVVGGAFATTSFSLILLALGAGMGLSVVSPWKNAGVSASTFGTAAITWMIVVEVVASALGGYLTGRLRIKWAVIHTDEVFFRDTANGFLAWAVAVVVTATLLASAALSMIGSSLPATDTGEQAFSSNAYFADMLLRSEKPAAEKDPALQAETGRIFAHLMKQNEIPATDKSYLAAMISARTGISSSEADKRVSEVVARARQVEDDTRKVTARMLLWNFLALLMGAFSSSFAATIGGRQRDHVKLV